MTESVERYLRMFKALSNPHRLRILLKAVENVREEKTFHCEGKQETTCQRDHAEVYAIAPSTMSHHMKELVYAGLLTMERDGQRTVWGLNREGIHALHVFIEELDP